MKPILMTSNSDIGTFKRCRRKWVFGSFNARNLVPKLPNLKFWIGTGCHYALERWHGHGEDPIEAFIGWALPDIEAIRTSVRILPQSFDADMRETMDLAVGILKHYVQYAEVNIIPHYKFVATEYEFSVPIPNRHIELLDFAGNPYQWVIDTWGMDWRNNEQFKKLYIDRGLFSIETNADGGEVKYTSWATIPPLFVGRLDGIVMDSDRSAWVIDHKFLASMPDDELLLIDEQTAKYVWAAQIAIDNGWWPEVPPGTRLRGALYNVCRKKVPRIPEMTAKTGRTSAAKNIDTTYEVFKNTLISRGENPKDYVEVLMQLHKKGNNFFKLKKIERGPRELALVGERLSFEYGDMNSVVEKTRNAMHPAFYPSPKMDCTWSCAFRRLCYTTNYGGDVEDMIKDTMVSQERRDLYATQVEEYDDI